MRMQKVGRDTFVAAGTNKVYQYSSDDINGLLLTAVADTVDSINPWYAADFLTVTMRHKNRADVLIQRVPIQLLAYWSALNEGFDYDTAEVFRRAINEIETLAADTTIFNQLHQFPILVPLGSLYLDDAELDISIESDPAATGDRIFGVSAYFDTPDVDYLQKYRLVKDTNTNLSDVHQAYITSFNNPGRRVIQDDYDVVCTVRHREHTWIDHASQFSGYTNAAMRAHGVGQAELAMIFESDDSIPDRIHVQLQGTDAANTEIFVCERKFYPDRVKKSQMKNVVRHKAKVTEMAQEEPEKTKALADAGMVADPDSV